MMSMFALMDRLSSGRKQAIALAIDTVMLPFALWSAIALRLGEWTPDVVAFWPAFLVSAVVCVPVFGTLGLYRHIIRYMGRDAFVAILKGVTITSIAIAAVAYMVPLTGFPRSVPVIFWLLSLVYVTGTRFLVRTYAESVIEHVSRSNPVVIYGAGETGIELARQLQQAGDHFPVAFLDDDPTLRGRVIHGLQVHAPDELGQLTVLHRVREVMLAMPHTPPRQRGRIIAALEPYGVRVRMIPDIGGLLARSSPLQPRDVQIEDLLGRDEVDPLDYLLEGSVRDRSVMVTGGGGSIGSELSRQIMRLKPTRLVVVDHSEFALFQIENDLRDIAEVEAPDVSFVPLLGNITDEAFMRRAMEAFEVETVYHAAAYKHVHLVEQNVVPGIVNNTFGTLATAQAAVQAGVSRFILISTDKAVRTSNVMGASKRLAEMVLQAMQEDHPETCFSMVRFGNVLGSSGSVVPLFLKQIETGGPVTVRHPEVTRYFMTISEAVELVLQSGSMASGGDVFLLDMGRPVNIHELARRLVRLKGFSIRDDLYPDGDIEIRFTGLKPGEKMHEELLIGTAASGTKHRKILRAEEAFVRWAELEPVLDELREDCERFDVEACKHRLLSVIDGASFEPERNDASQGADILELPRTRSS